MLLYLINQSKKTQTYRHACTVRGIRAVLQATLVVSVIYHPWQHCGKFEVMFCRLIIKTAAPTFAAINK